MKRSIAVPAAAACALIAPAAAGAHVSIHPNVVPTGAFTTLSIHVPNEAETPTTKIAVRLPPGFLDVSPTPPPGWKVTTKSEKLATPVKTDDGTITEQIREVDFTGSLPPEQTVILPISTQVPGKAGGVLTFPTVQTYSGGKVARWIGPPSDEMPAPTIDITAKGGVIEDIAGGEAGPPASVPAAATSAPAAKSTPAATRVVEKSTGASKGLAVAALVVGLLGLLIGGAALATRRRPAA